METTGKALVVFLGTFLAIGFEALGTTELDWRFFPKAGSREPPAIIVQANWAEPAGTDEKGWVPVRLFGTTNAKEKELKLNFSLPPGHRRGKITVRTREKDAEEVPGDSGKILAYDAVVTPTFGQWWWEGFIQVSETDERESSDPYFLELKIRNGAGVDLRLDLVLGECWLIAGGPQAGIESFAPVASPENQLVAFSGGNFSDGRACLAMSRPVREKLEIAPETAEKAPALAGMFARELAAKYPSRPVCVYTWSKARVALWGADTRSQWMTGSTLQLGPAWDGFLTGTESGAPLPGVRGVVWWQGEWDVEYGDHWASAPYACDVQDFRKRYTAFGANLAEKVRERLGMTGAGKGKDDDELSKRTLWIVAQSPGAGRKPEFNEAFDEAADGATSAWAALRAAQFDIVKNLRAAQPAGSRPMALAVPLMGAGELGWVWRGTEARGRARFDEAGKRLARAVAMNREMKDSSDGWPSVEWKAVPVLKLPGVKELAAPPEVSAPGVRRPQMETFDGKAWSLLPLEDGKAEYDLPLSTTKIRYGWADATGGLHGRIFRVATKVPFVVALPPVGLNFFISEVEIPASDPLPLPAFEFQKPTN